MITKNDLINWLGEIDKKLKEKIILIAVGGTAMTLLGLKPSTRDVDFCVEGKDAAIFRRLSRNNQFKVDIFHDGFIFSEQLPDDYIEKSNKISADFTKIDLRTLSLADIILTKAARYNERDEEDIARIASTNKVNKQELTKRFKQVSETFAGREEDYKYHFNLILRRHFK
jgi:hypothetical protein